MIVLNQNMQLEQHWMVRSLQDITNYGTILAFFFAEVFLSCSEKFTYVRGKGKRTKTAIDAPVLLMK